MMRSGRNKLPAAFSSTAVERFSPAARLHALEEAVGLLPLSIGDVPQMFFHRPCGHYTNPSRANQGEIA